MDDEELEAIRRRRLQELQAQAGNQVQADEQERAAQAQVQAALRQILTPEARERLGRFKMARPEFAQSVEKQLVMLAQNGRLSGPVNDGMLKEILNKVLPQKKEINIKRR